MVIFTGATGSTSSILLTLLIFELHPAFLQFSWRQISSVAATLPEVTAYFVSRIGLGLIRGE